MIKPKIKNISCHRIINSRGDWTIETTVSLDDGSVGIQPIPDGASKGENEAVYVPVNKAVEVVGTLLNDALEGLNPFDQESIDSLMLQLDGTSNKKHLGANSILSVSLGVARACAKSEKLHLYEYLSKLYSGSVIKSSDLKFPTPVFNILNGGKHAHNDLSFQEFMVIPSPSLDYEKALDAGVEVYQLLKKRLLESDNHIAVGDEGGFAPEGFNVKKALDFIRDSAKMKYKVGEDIFFGMDVAAESFYQDGFYNIPEENLKLTTDELLSYHKDLIKNYEIIFLEDPFYEQDYIGWQKFYEEMSDKLMIVADDLVVTNPKFLKEAIKNKLANAVIVKPNQVGTLTETFEFIRLARENNMSICISHRSGETGEDTFIADLALAVGADFMKSGAPVRGERVVKYNRLLDIYLENYLKK